MHKLYFILVTLLLAACKPQVSLSGASYPVEAKTVSVAFFKNQTTLGPPSLSTRFTEALKDRVARQTRLDLIKSNGDLQLDGYIADYNITPVAIQSNDQAALNRMTITVQVVYFNTFDKTKNFNQAFTQFVDYDSRETLSAVEAGLMEEINRKLTEDIFNMAFNNW